MSHDTEDSPPVITSRETSPLPGSLKPGRKLPDSSSIPRRYVGYVYLAMLGTALALYAPVIRSFFIFDDLSHIAKVLPSSFSWLDCFRPWNNGFWRPFLLLENKTLLILFGLHPLPFHLVSILFHALVGVLTWRLYVALHDHESIMGVLAGVLMVVHIGAWACVALPQNISDEFLAVAFLSGLLAWNAWLKGSSSGYLWATCIWFLVALMSKESAVVFPALLFLWAMAKGRTTRRILVVGGVLSIVAALFILFFLHLQTHATSYLMSGRVHFQAKSTTRQFCDYLIATYIPYLYTMTSPFLRLVPSNITLWIGRICVLMLIGSSCLIFYVRRPWRPVLFPLLAAVVILAPSTLIGNSPVGHYLYSALPLASIFLVSCLERMKRRGFRWAFGAIIGVSSVWGILGFYSSPTVIGYRTTTRAVSHLVTALKEEAPKWGKGARIVILDHPHPGTAPWRWAYCQEIMNIFIPKAHATVLLEEEPSADHSYRFRNGKLIPIKPASNAPEKMPPHSN